MFETCETGIPDLFEVRGLPFADQRGAFMRLFCRDDLKSILGERNILQINHSLTRETGAVRGLHYQNPPCAEMKLVRCLRGRVFDVAVDLRSGSPNFLQFFATELTPEKSNMVVIPEGFAHGFQVLEANSELLYLHTAPYMPSAEGGIAFNDPRIGITWPLPHVDVSVRDLNHPPLRATYEGIEL